MITDSVTTKFGPEAEVLYESPHTVILNGKPEENSKLFWEALDYVKQQGYKIDSVAQITESNTLGDTRFLSPVYTVFLSK